MGTDPVAIAVIVVAVFVYLLPAIVALWRGHRQTAAILVLNLLLGWSFIGWVVALVWAVTRQSGEGRQTLK